MRNPLDLREHTILVTGASSGIGRATAVLLAQLGARLVLAGRRPEALERTRALLEGAGHLVQPFDLAAVDEIPAWMKGLPATPLHGVVHCAGAQPVLPLRYLANEKLEAVMRLNLGAAVGLARGLRQKGVRAPRGCSLVFLSSVMGLVGQPGRAAYAASKGALLALTKSLALELAEEGIRVNAVAPAYVRTEATEALQRTLGPEQVAAIEAMHPLGIGTPEDVACAVAFLLAGTARWVTGTTLVVDGGYTAR